MGNRRKIYLVDGKNYLIDTERLCLYEVDFIGPLTNGVRVFSCLLHGHIKGERRYGCVDEGFNEVICCQYTHLSIYRNGVYKVSLINPAYPNKLTSKHFYFFIDKNGIPIHFVETNGKIETIIQFNNCKAISEFNSWGLAISLSYDDKQGIVCSDGNVFLESKYDIVCMNNVQRHIEVEVGNVCRSILYFEGINKWKFIPKGYMYQSINEKGRFFVVKYENNVSILDFNSRQIVPPIYKKLICREAYIIATDDNGKKGLLDRNNYQKILLDFEYSKIEESYFKYVPLKDPILVIVKDNKQGLYSMSKKEIILPTVLPVTIKLIPDFINDGFILFEDFCKIGFLDKDGNILSEFIGEIISLPSDGVIIIRQGLEYMKLDKLGNVVEKGKIQKEYDMHDEYDMYDEYDSVVYTEEDTWDAMTDGMYGDYPGGDIDYEAMGF